MATILVKYEKLVKIIIMDHIFLSGQVCKKLLIQYSFLCIHEPTSKYNTEVNTWRSNDLFLVISPTTKAGQVTNYKIPAGYNS